MKLTDLITPECILAPLQATEKQSVINELVTALADAGQVSDAQLLMETVWTREQTRTTGIGQGLAIPHGKSESLKDMAMAIGKPADPIDFESVDGKPVRLVVLLASRPDQMSDHIQALAKISRLHMDNDFREKIYAANTPEEIYQLLVDNEAN
ncbi:MAG: PTS sugar transporter subunit IIA [Phycisphaera sp.]|nr:MAG: PTS sugar transporter subunit IIA [Phycisphaera sp.]